MQYPSGEWLNEQGEMKEDFIRWVAEEWIKFPPERSHTHDIQKIMSDVLVYFVHEPEEIPIQWEIFQNTRNLLGEN